MSRIQIEVDEALRKNRKTSMVVKSNQVKSNQINKALCDPVFQAGPGIPLSILTSWSHGGQRNTGGGKDPKISPHFSS